MPAPEEVLQTRIVGWMTRYLAPPPEGPYWCAVNPVPSKTLLAAVKSKKMGMKAGIADLLLVWQGRVLFPELKAPKGTLSGSQKQFHREATLAGAVCVVVRSLEEFVGFLEMLSVPIKRGGLEALR